MSRKQNKSQKSGPGRPLFLALLIATLLGAIAYNFWWNSAQSLARIRELGRQDPAAALELLDATNDRSRDSRLLRCQLLAASRHWEQAELAFEEIADPELCRQDELIELASLALGSGIFSLADKVLDADYRRGDPQPALLRAMIDVKYQSGFDQQALPLCNEMSKLTPDDPFPWLVSAKIYHHAEKIDLAIDAYREALRRDLDERDERQARFQIADMSIYVGDLDTAGQQLDHLAAELPGDPDVGLLRAKLLHRKGSFEASLQVLDAVLAARPDMVPALLERGVLHLERENLTQAARDLKQVTTLAPENYTGHYKLGLAYQRLNQPELAARHRERSSQITDRITEEKAQAEERRRAKVRAASN